MENQVQNRYNLIKHAISVLRNGKINWKCQENYRRILIVWYFLTFNPHRVSVNCSKNFVLNFLLFSDVATCADRVARRSENSSKENMKYKKFHNKSAAPPREMFRCVSVKYQERGNFKLQWDTVHDITNVTASDHCTGTKNNSTWKNEFQAWRYPESAVQHLEQISISW